MAEGTTHPHFKAKACTVDAYQQTLIFELLHKNKNITDWDEAVNLTRQIFVAGNETTTSLISNLVWRMMTIDNLWEKFVNNDIDINDAISESLRYDPPLLGLFKTTSKEVDIDGYIIPKNSKVMMHYGAANRDPVIFNDPNKIAPGAFTMLPRLAPADRRC